jgi:hypothetical protein
MRRPGLSGQLPQSAEEVALLAALPAGAVHALHEYLHGDSLMIYAAMDVIRHHRQLSLHFARLWPGAG